MCRFLMMRAQRAPGHLDDRLDARAVLETFRKRCRDSTEYQGDGWGATWRTAAGWSRYRSLTPIWQDRLELPRDIDFLVLHARSAFADSAVAVENNMPFYDGERIFVFNGELRGVRLRLPGKIGAEKVFKLIQRKDRGNPARAIADATRLIDSRSRYVRGLNVAITDGDRIHAGCRFSESPDYFTLYYSRQGIRAVSSEPLDDSYLPMANGQCLSV